MSSDDPSTWSGVLTVAAAGAFGAAIDIVRRFVRTRLRIMEKRAGLDPSSGEDM